MAIFETGASVSMPALLDALADFCVDNGWTQNANAVEGSGRRVHLQLDSDVFINLRALVTENPNPGSGSGVSVDGILVSGSTGYSGAATWCRQAGAPTAVSEPLNIKLAGIIGILGAVPAYYFFARDSMIYVWVEYATGLYQWFMFGRVAKIATWTGGMFFAGSFSGASNSAAGTTGRNIAGTPSSSMHNGINGNANAYLYGTVDALTGWMPASNASMGIAMPKVFDTMVLDSVNFINLSNSFNTQPVLAPVELCITRDGTANWNVSTSNFSIEAVLPDLYFCNTRTLLGGQQLDDGSGDVFRVLPFKNKTSNGSDGGFFGVAIKEN
jgi:hypothetical protein